MRQQSQEAIAHDARGRHRDPQIIDGRKDEADILVAHWRGESSGFEPSLGYQLAVSLVDGRVEQAGRQDLDIFLAVDAILDAKSDSLAL
jgi:hypothetical protein